MTQSRGSLVAGKTYPALPSVFTHTLTPLMPRRASLH